MTRLAYACIRNNKAEKRHWIDYTSIGHTEDEAVRKGRRYDEENPEWAELNPRVRLSKVEIKEIDTLPISEYE